MTTADAQPQDEQKTREELPPDVVCEHGTAMDVHCCGCHGGFLFDIMTCKCWRGDDGDES
jgi:hypothetical protein